MLSATMLLPFLLLSATLQQADTLPPRDSLLPRPRTELRALLGFTYATHRDETASPLRYLGGGLGLALELERASPRRRWNLGMRAAMPTLTTSTTRNDLPRQEVFDLDLLIGRHWRVYPSWSRGALYLGPRLSLGTTLRNHVYPAQIGDDQAFVFMNLALGPEMVAESDLGARGSFRYGATLPFVALVERPYSDIRVLAREGLTPRFATIVALQNPEALLEYRRTMGRRSALLVHYRGRATIYASDAPWYRAVDNNFAVGFTVR
jgi:hypothetical protein